MNETASQRLELRLLGTLELVDRDGEPIPSVLAQPKRLALLCYLALAGPATFHRRDALLAIFWPEIDTARGRHALSQALHFLRQHVGPDVVVTRGAEDVGVDTARLWCDAVALEEGLDRGDLAGALSLYGGDLLEAFFLTDALAFERWLETQRARLRRRVVEAALRVSEGGQRAGDTETAVRWAHWAVARAPEDEAAVRRVAAALEYAGDRAGALQALDRFVAWLAAELDAPPTPETAALISALRAGEALPPAPPTPADPVTPASATRADPAQSSDLGAPRAVSRAAGPGVAWRPALAWAGLLLLLLVAGGLGAYRLGLASQAADGADAAASARTVLIMPFEYHGSAGAEYTAGAARELLRVGLEGTDGLQAIDPRVVPDGAVPENGDDSGAAWRALADRFGAGSYIRGAVAETSGQLRLSVTWYERDGRAMGRATAQGRTDDLFELVDRLAAELLTGRQAGPAGRFTRSAAGTTTSLAALKAFMEGERQFAGGQFGAAAESFRAALAEDSTFALAHYRLSTVAEYLGNSSLALGSAEAAVRHASGLPPITRSLMAALLATRRGDPDRAEYLLREVLASHQHEVEAWFQLGEVLFHYGPANGRPIRESRRAWEAVLELEPDNVAALYHMLRVLAVAGERAALAGLVERMAKLSPRHERVWAMRAVESVTAGGEAVRRMARKLAAVDDPTLYMAVFDAIVFAPDPALVRPLVAVMTHPDRPRDVRSWGHLWLAHLELGLGRPHSAREHLARLASLDPLAATEYSALLALHPLVEPPATTLESLRTRFLGGRPEEAPSTSPDFPSAIHPQLRPHLYPYLYALVSERAGGAELLERIASALEAEARPGSTAMAMATTLRGVEARAVGDFATALERLDAARFRDWYEPARWSAFLGQGHERWLIAETLVDLDRPREALRWYESVPQNSALDVVHRAGSHLRRAEIHERLGEADRAAEQYARFLELWGDCEPELRPVVEDARQRLARLSGQPGTTP